MGFQSKIRQKSLENANIDFSVNLSYLETPRLFKTKNILSSEISNQRTKAKKDWKNPDFIIVKDFLFRSDSNWRFGDSIRNYLATLSSKKSQLASKKLQFGYGEMIHWFITRRREDQDLKKPVVNKLNRRRRSPMPAFRKSLLVS